MKNRLVAVKLLRYRIWKDWSVSLWAMFGRRPFLRKSKLIFFLRQLPLILTVNLKLKQTEWRYLLEDPWYWIWTNLGFEYTINPQNLMKIVGAIFEKIEILNFFLCELPLILGLGRKLKKKAPDICERNPRYLYWTRSVDWFKHYVRCRSDRHTHKDIFF